MTVYCTHCKILYCTNGFDGSFAVSPQSVKFKETKKKKEMQEEEEDDLKFWHLECHYNLQLNI